MRDGEIVEIGHPSGVKKNIVYIRSSIVSKTEKSYPCFVCQSGSFSFDSKLMSSLIVLLLLFDCESETWH